MKRRRKVVARIRKAINMIKGKKRKEARKKFGTDKGKEVQILAYAHTPN